MRPLALRAATPLLLGPCLAGAKLVVKPGERHGWVEMRAEDAQIADWCDAHLLNKP